MPTKEKKDGEEIVMKHYRVLRPIAWKGERIEVGRYLYIDEVEALNIGEEFLIEETPKDASLLGAAQIEENTGSYDDDDDGVDLEKLSNKELDSFAKENFDLDTTSLKHADKIAAIEEAANVGEEFLSEEDSENTEETN